MIGGRSIVVSAMLCLLCACGAPPEQRARVGSDSVREVSASELKSWMSSGQPLTLIDVREDNEWEAGHAATAIHAPRWTLSGKIAAIAPEKTARIVLYCRSGVRSAAAASTLKRLGYSNVFSLAGGFQSYQSAGLPAQR